MSDSNKTERKFSLYEIAHFEDPGLQSGFPSFSACTIQQMNESLRQLAEITKRYGKDFLRNNTIKFEQLREQSQRNSEKLTQEMQFHNTRREAEIAWQKKDYSLAIKLYESMRECLSPAEIEKLKYAKKRYAKSLVSGKK